MGAHIDQSVVEELLSDPFSFTDEALMESSSSDEAEEPQGSAPDRQVYLTMLDLPDREFHDRFHVGKSVHATLTGLLDHATGCTGASPGLAALLLLRYLRTVDRSTEVGREFDLTGCCTKNIIDRAVRTVAGTVGPVQWQTSDRRYGSSRCFYDVSRIEGAIGSIEVSHVEVEPPVERMDEYLDGSGRCSVALQAIVSFDCKFLDVFLSEGSDDPYRILEKSCVDLDDMEKHFLVGNHQSYGRSGAIVTPFPDGERPTWHHERFNKNLEIVYTRSLKAFGHLKGRFPRLQRRLEGGVSFAADCVRAACALHNLCADVEECKYFVRDVGVPRSHRAGAPDTDELRERVFTNFLHACAVRTENR